MIQNFFPYLSVMALTTFGLRVLPLTLLRQPIQNQYLRSFLFYVPYVTLAVMTFPAIMDSTQLPIAGLLAFLAGIALAWSGGSILKVAASCCAVVLVAEWFLLK